MSTKKSPSEVYEGILSRNWPKLLDALEQEKRVLIVMDSITPYDEIVDIANAEYYISGYTYWVRCTFGGNGFSNKAEAIEWLEENGVGFFPANEEEK